MNPPRAITAATARRFLVLRHLLAPPRALPADAPSVLAVVDRLGSLQFDPLGVAGRNHDLVLHARVAGYDPRWTEDLLYSRRLLFEAYNKGLSILPTRELPWFRVAWDRASVAHERGIFAEHGEHVEELLERIRRDGPLSTAGFARERPIDWYWGPTSKTRAALEALAESGRLGIARRDGNRRFYDLVERLFPADLLAVRVPPREQFRHRLLSRHRGVGLLGRGGNAELWLGTGPVNPDPDEPERPTRTELREDLVAAGELTPVEVEDLAGQRYAVTDEVPLLAQAEREVAAGEPPGGVSPGVTFLAPLDPLAWDRDLLRRLFGFDYVWEVYVPAAKRRWGYYVLPILFGDRFVGRIEPRLERARGGSDATVRILGLWWEDGFDPLAEPALIGAFADALADYLAFAKAATITWVPEGGAQPRARARDRAFARAVGRELATGRGLPTRRRPAPAPRR